MFSSSVLSLLAVRLVEGVHSAKATRGVVGATIHTDVSDKVFPQHLQESLLGQQRVIGHGTEVPPLITEIAIFAEAIKSKRFSETDRQYIQNTRESEDQDILRAIQPKNPKSSEEVEAIIFQHLEIKKDLHRAGIGPDDSLRADENDIRRLITGVIGEHWNFERNPTPFFQGMSSLATAVLLDAGAKAAADEGADTASQTRREIMMRVNARQNYQNLFKKNWILNQSIIGAQGKSTKQVMDDIIDKLADQVRKILVDTTDRKFLTQIEKVEKFRDVFAGMYPVGETLFVKSCPNLQIVQKFLHVFLKETADAPEDAIPDVANSILPHLLASTIVQFRKEFTDMAEIRGQPTPDCKSSIPSFQQAFSSMQLSTIMTDKRADRLIERAIHNFEPTKQFLEAVQGNVFEISRTPAEDQQDAANKDFTIEIGDFKITKSYWDLKKVAQDLGHIGCWCGSNSHGFPGWWSYKFSWFECGWNSIANRLNGWAQVKESKEALVQEFREEFIESCREVILNERYKKIHNANIADWQEGVCQGAPSRWETDVLPQVVSDDERDSFSTAELIDEGVEGF